MRFKLLIPAIFGTFFCLVQAQTAATSVQLLQFTHTAAGVGGSPFISMRSDGGEAVFCSSHDLLGKNADHNSEIFVFKEEGRTLQQLTQSSAGHQTGVSMSSNGSRIVFLSWGDLLPSVNAEITLMERSTGAVQRITPLGSGVHLPPIISGDGNRIAFWSTADLVGQNPDRFEELFYYDVAKGHFQQVTRLSPDQIGKREHYADLLLSLSFDGSRMVFSSSIDPYRTNTDRNYEIFLFDTRNQSLTQVTQTAGGFNDHPTISGDGSLIAFRSNRLFNGMNPSGEITLYNSVTRSFMPITQSSGDEGINLEPLLTKQGNRIVFSASTDLVGANPDHSLELFVYDIASRFTFQATRSEKTPHLAYTVNNDGTRVGLLSRYNADGRNPEGNNENFLAVIPSVLTSASPAIDSGSYNSTGLTSLHISGGVPVPDERSYSLPDPPPPNVSSRWLRLMQNLLPNAQIAGTQSWTLIGADYDPVMTRSLGGSFKLNSLNESVRTGFIPVIPGRVYSFSVYLRSAKDAWPSVVQIIPQRYDGSKVFLGNVQASRQSPSKPDEWQEGVVFYLAQPGDAYLRVTYKRLDGPVDIGDVWLDDFYVGEKLSFNEPPEVKNSFKGLFSQVDAYGNFYIKGEPFFPLAIYQDTYKRTDYSIYSDQGFNTVMFGQMSATVIQRAKNASMYAFTEISQYCDPRFPKYGDYIELNRRMVMLLLQPASNSLLGYYFDNEAYGDYNTHLRVIDDIRSWDTTRLIHMNTGNQGMARVYNEHINTIGDYLTNDRLGGLILDNLHRQTIPLGIGIVTQDPKRSDTPGPFRFQVYNHLIWGGKGITWYRDGDGVDSLRPDVTSLPMWGEVPSIKAELDRLQPLLRQKHWTPWRSTVNNKYVIVGSRDYAGRGYLFLQNSVGISQPVTVTLRGISASTAVDFFSGQRVGDVINNQLVLTLSSYGTKVLLLE